MHEIVYKNAVLTPKQFGNAPLTLHNKPTGENAFYGYDTSDTNFLSQQWAKETGSYYFDLNDFMEAVHLGNTKKIEQYKKQLKDKKKIITSDLVLGTNKEQTGLAYNHWESLFTKLKDIWTDTSLDERRIVIPLSLTFGLGQHAAVACLNFKPKQETAEIIFMEQHAQKKGEAEYDAGFDYTKGIQLHAKAWTDVMKSENYGFLGIKSVNTFVK